MQKEDEIQVRKKRTTQIRQNRMKLQDNLKKNFLRKESTFENRQYQQSIRLRSRTQNISPLTLNNQQDLFYEISNFQKKYILHQKIGQGMHSVVYKCIQKKTQQEYAVKVTNCNSQQFFIIVEKAFNLIQTLNHPSIIKAKQLIINIQNSTSYMITELENCPTLRQYMNKSNLNHFKQSFIKSILIKIMNAISYLHQNQICHRDIKPQNILYDPKTKALKIIDFEIAYKKKTQDNKFQMWTDTGSLYYRAPQSFQAGYDQKIDIWSIGVVAFELCTKQLPFKAQLASQTIKTIRQNKMKPEKINLLNDFSQQLKKFVLRLLNKNSQQRPTIKQALNDQFMQTQDIIRQKSNTVNGGLSSQQTNDSRSSQVFEKSDLKTLLKRNKSLNL